MLKADGLAAGKGVLIPQSEEEAIAGLKNILVENVFGAAGKRSACGICAIPIM